MLDRLKRRNAAVFFSGRWEAYAELMPPGALVQSKAETHGVERNNFRQRHWFARFRRRTRVVSRSLQMVGLTMFLFAKHVENVDFDYITLFN